MAFIENGGLRYFVFDSFTELGVVHGIFTRHGGVSPQPWQSLNLGGTVGDERDHVIENRSRIFNLMDRPVVSIYDSWQVHGTHVICATQPRPLDGVHEKGDAILTNTSNITLFMRFADCVPIFLVDPIKKVAGIVHAGWRGTVNGIASEAVKVMKNQYDCDPETIYAGIGPSICVDHYQVGAEVIDCVRNTMSDIADHVLKPANGSFHLNLWEFNRLVLQRSGVKNIEVSGICTACFTTDWYSHRAERGKTGRFGALLALA